MLLTGRCARPLVKRPRSLLQRSVSPRDKSEPVWKVLLLLNRFVSIIHTPVLLVFLFCVWTKLAVLPSGYTSQPFRATVFSRVQGVFAEAFSKCPISSESLQIYGQRKKGEKLPLSDMAVPVLRPTLIRMVRGASGLRG